MHCQHFERQPLVQGMQVGHLEDTIIQNGPILVACSHSVQSPGGGGGNLQEGILVQGWDILVAVDGHHVAVLLAHIALPLQGVILVVLLRVQAAVLHDESECEVHQTACIPHV